MRRGGLLTSLLILPLSVPVLIFGVSIAEAAITAAPGQSGRTALLLLTAYSLSATVLGPIAGAAALRALRQ